MTTKAKIKGEAMPRTAHDALPGEHLPKVTHRELEAGSYSERQARAQYESIADMVRAWEKAGDDDEKRDNAEFVIHADALSVEVRSGWYAPGLHVRGEEQANRPAEYMILLCTGGPAVRIIGTLNEHGEPDTARIEHQNWGTPWTEYRLDSEQERTVLTYAQCFYYGE